MDACIVDYETYTLMHSFIVRFTANGALDTSYQSETYRRASIPKPSAEYELWMGEEIAYCKSVILDPGGSVGISWLTS